MTFRFERRYTGKLQGVIFDWAGTTVDYGCFAPMMVFIEGFRARGVEITLAEARIPMGKHKRDHIAAIMAMPRVNALWREVHGAEPTEADIDAVFADFIPRQIDIIADYADLIPGTVETVTALRERGMQIGSCTGYTAAMMDALIPVAAANGYKPDFIVTGDQVLAGRPEPWMALHNAQLMRAYPLSALVKVGDTVADIDEGLNAGMWTVGIAKTGNELGMTAAEVAALDDAALKARLAPVYDKLYQAGAHYVIAGIADMLPVIDAIESRLAAGERP